MDLRGDRHVGHTLFPQKRARLGLLGDLGLFGLLEAEDQIVVGDADHVAVVEFAAVLGFVVDECAVLTPQVFDEPLVALAEDPGVEGRDSRERQSDLVDRRAPDPRLALEHQALGSVWSVPGERGHACPLHRRPVGVFRTKTRTACQFGKDSPAEQMARSPPRLD